MACVCGHDHESHQYEYGHCEVESCQCYGYDSDFLELARRVQRPLDEDLINDPFICFLLCGVDYGIDKTMDHIH